jgi:hypothetical protein
MSRTTTWIGLAHVRPQEQTDLLDGALGAYVWVVAMAADEGNFVSIATDALQETGFDVIEIDDVEPWAVRVTRAEVGEEISEVVASLTLENPVGFGPFDCYDAE